MASEPIEAELKAEQPIAEPITEFSAPPGSRFNEGRNTELLAEGEAESWAIARVRAEVDAETKRQVDAEAERRREARRRMDEIEVEVGAPALRAAIHARLQKVQGPRKQYRVLKAHPRTVQFPDGLRITVGGSSDHPVGGSSDPERRAAVSAARALVAVRRRTGRPIPQQIVDLANSPD